MPWRLVKDQTAFEEIQKRFDSIVDASGRPMSEVCKEYWQRKKKEHRGRS